MRTEPLDLDLNGTRLRVVCGDPDGASILRSALAQDVTDEPAPLSFYIEAPKKRRKLFILLDRSGFVLGRTRKLEDALSILGSHLAAFRPAPDGTVRLRMRALVDEQNRAVLAMPPLLMTPPLIERRLVSLNYRMVDRLVVDIDRDCRLHVPRGEWLGLSDVGDGPGHVSSLAEPAPTTSLMVPSAGSVDAASTAKVVQAVASTCMSNNRHDVCLDIAEVLAKTSHVPIEWNEPDRVYAALRRS